MCQAQTRLQRSQTTRWLTHLLVAITTLIGPRVFAEIVTHDGVHLSLTSDVADPELLADLVGAFDQAVPQWLDFWEIAPERADGWRVNGYLMRDSETFRTLGVLPPQLPSFQFGFSMPGTIWVHQQSTAYYNRHLILHEGVHALALELFGGCGPSWYMEGVAELLSTHRDRRLISTNESVPLLAQMNQSFRINDLPRARSEAPMWGRYRVIRERRQANTLPSLASVLKLPMNLAGDVESYTWCWANALMMTSYPDTRELFIQASRNGRDQTPAFTSKYFREIQDRWPVMRARWQLWLHDLEYGFDPTRNLVSISVDDPRYDGTPIATDIDAGQGWQSAGVWFPKKARLRFNAEGRCVIVNHQSIKPEDGVLIADWNSEPDGITAKYHGGFPIGQLQACVLPIPNSDDRELSAPEIRGWSTRPDGSMPTIQIDQPSWLLFRIHDVPGQDGTYQRSDNVGGYRVTIEKS